MDEIFSPDGHDGGRRFVGDHCIEDGADLGRHSAERSLSTRHITVRVADPQRENYCTSVGKYLSDSDWNVFKPRFFSRLKNESAFD